VVKLTFLGSGTSLGVPLIGCSCDVCTSPDERDKRLRASVLIEAGGFNFVIDAGPDFRQQLLRERVGHVDAILLTHEHWDHVAGLEEVRSLNWFQRQAMAIYGQPQVLKHVRIRFDYAFADERYPGVPDFKLYEVGPGAFRFGEVEFIPIEVNHGDRVILGYRIGNMAYLTDVSSITTREMDKLQGCDVLILNALMIMEHPSHFSLSQALRAIEQLMPKRAYLTHISHKLGLHHEVSAHLPKNVFLAYDGLSIESE
jgi:phosphoribosyl 1,2-cyclic phosphate phosphodiesterase